MTLAFRAVANPLAGPIECPTPTRSPLAFHRELPGYEPTPLVSVPVLADHLGVRELLVKCEASRFGLPAFKMLGASWATYRAICEHEGIEIDEEDVAGPDAPSARGRDPRTADGGSVLSALAERLHEAHHPLRLAAATDGNHGRAVARMARLLGLDARIFVPAGTTRGRIETIASEGADVTVVNGGFDDAVRRSAEEAGPRCLVISDTSWPGYTQVPRWVIEGYSTMFFEIEDALESCGHAQPDLVVVPIGVGALCAAAVTHFRPRGAHLLGVEPTDAACLTSSVLAGDRISLQGAQRSMMAGLNCGTPSLVAWPIVSRGVDGFVTIDDDWTRQAVRDLAAAGIEAGETGAAGLAGLTALQKERRTRGRAATSLSTLLEPTSSVLVLMTEGASDVGTWRAILGVEEVCGPLAAAGA